MTKYCKTKNSKTTLGTTSYNLKFTNSYKKNEFEIVSIQEQILFEWRICFRNCIISEFWKNKDRLTFCLN